jgi:HD-GYP domain-containing protein (c-di-GMP phosphodiesterase class II)
MSNTEGLCRAIREEGLIVRLLDGDLPPSEEHTVLTHLRTCHECLGLTADLLYTDERLKDLFARQEEKKQKQRQPSQGAFLLEVDKLPIGRAIDRDLLDGEGRLLVAAGTELTQALVESLKRRGIDKLAVEPAEIKEEEKPEDLAVPVVSIRQIEGLIESEGLTPAISQFVRQKCSETVAESFRALEQEGQIDLGGIHETAQTVTEEVLTSPQVALTLADLILYDPGLHSHSVNVLIIFLTISRAMGHPAQLIRDHATAALLHDIGRIVLRRGAQAGGVQLSPEDERSEHTEAGYSYLWNLGGITESALKMVMNHHERYDGMGYPRRLKGTTLSDWDQILILANMYENLTWNRSTGLRSGFHDALATLIQDGSKIARKGIIRGAIQAFGHYPPGSWVRMNSGEIGLVMKSQPGSPLKPFVTVMYDSTGRRHPKPRSVDLTHSQGAYILGPVPVECTP